MTSYKYTFTPFLFENRTFWDVPEEYRKNVLDWYDDKIRSYANDEDIHVFNIYYEKDEISFEIDKCINTIVLESFVDPDSDGNYPIEIDNITYLIIGKNYYLNNKITQ